MGDILLTLKYFDLFDYPLKADEIVRWFFSIGAQSKKRHYRGGLFKYSSLALADIKDIRQQLNRLTAENKIEEKDGYFFLAGRSAIIKSRQEREKISFKKIKKAQRAARLLGLVPGVKMIAVVSNLGYLNADVGADIDLFIVCKKGKIWGVRFWCVMLMKLLGQRPNKKTIKDKICLSYYVDEDNLNLEPTKVVNPDIHLCYLVSQYLPLYSEDGMWEKYVEQNKWVNKHLLNFRYSDRHKRFIIKPKFLWLKEIVAKTEFGFEEKFYKEIQMRKMAPQLKSAMNKGDKKVIISDKMLKLHLNDRREEINSKIINSK